MYLISKVFSNEDHWFFLEVSTKTMSKMVACLNNPVGNLCRGCRLGWNSKTPLNRTIQIQRSITQKDLQFKLLSSPVGGGGVQPEIRNSYSSYL